MFVPTETLNLMARFTTMDSTLEAFAIVDFVALPSAKWAHLVTPKRFGFHFLLEISNELFKLKRSLRRSFRIKTDFHLAHQALDEVLNIRDSLVLNIFLQIAGIKQLYPYVIMCN